MMISKLEGMLDTEVLTREMINAFEDDESMTSSQIEVARKKLDEASDCTKMQDQFLPSLELDEVFLVGQRDREAFLEPYNRSYNKALKIYADRELPYTQLDFEILTMIIMVE